MTTISKRLTFNNNVFIGKTFDIKTGGYKDPLSIDFTIKLSKKQKFTKSSEIIELKNASQSLSLCLGTTSEELFRFLLFHPDSEEILDFIVTNVPKYTLGRFEKINLVNPSNLIKIIVQLF